MAGAPASTFPSEIRMSPCRQSETAGGIRGVEPEKLTIELADPTRHDCIRGAGLGMRESDSGLFSN
jgi:hypothetical protein